MRNRAFFLFYCNACISILSLSPRHAHEREIKDVQWVHSSSYRLISYKRVEVNSSREAEIRRKREGGKNTTKKGMRADCSTFSLYHCLVLLPSIGAIILELSYLQLLYIIETRFHSARRFRNSMTCKAHSPI